jgi:SAM-dependent methyltransferase
METDSKAYHDYLEKKYLPGRSFYLRHLFYPRLFREFHPREPIVDLGCGTGEFLAACRARGWKCAGIDSNASLVNKCVAEGLDARLDDVCRLSTLKGMQLINAISDNVLEHLDGGEIAAFFGQIRLLLAPGGVLLCIVPGTSGFKRDPTHKTYIDQEFLSGALAGTGLNVAEGFFHPINSALVARLLYLNMQVFVVRRPLDQV